MKGTNVDFSTNIQSKKNGKSNEDSQIEFQGDIINFDLAYDKQKKQNYRTLNGAYVSLSINTIGNWSIEEKKPLVCMICKLPVKPTQKPHECPMCKSIFHDDHIFEWLKVKGKCPVCLQALRPGGTDEVKF